MLDDGPFLFFDLLTTPWCLLSELYLKIEDACACVMCVVWCVRVQDHELPTFQVEPAKVTHLLFERLANAAANFVHRCGLTDKRAVFPLAAASKSHCIHISSFFLVQFPKFKTELFQHVAHVLEYWHASSLCLPWPTKFRTVKKERKLQG